MKANFYCLYDRVSGHFMMPFPSLSDALAMRAVKLDSVNPQSPISKCSGDLVLYHSSSFDDETGCFVPMPKARMILSVTEILDADIPSATPDIDMSNKSFLERLKDKVVNHA